ncbi:hypothetical protein M422DRAFT_247043 [Sphaerobolus stellatus SS14]|nr:hypothetical protein M422DRAFT_247043 [Sphaerobolus stellatus SS14]
MLFTVLFTSLLAVIPNLTSANPLPEPAGGVAHVPRTLGTTGSYTVSGLGARKQQLIACGANELDIAIAMLETERMSTDYTYGDGTSSDSANFEYLADIFQGVWFAGHRDGSSGLANPNTQDIQNYKDAVYWIRNQVYYYNNSTGMTNDIRYWVNVPAI